MGTSGVLMLKKDLRKTYKKKRGDLSSKEVTSLSLNIEETLLNLLKQLSFNSINCFLSSSDKKEVETKQLIEKLFKLGKSVSVPVSNYDDFSIISSLLQPDTALKDDKFGIPTPKHIELVATASIDIVLVPLLCFDKNGYRCGYGKGMYDRFLNTCKKNVITIGLSFFPGIEKISDIDQFDVPLNYVVQGKKIIEFKK